MATTSTRTLWKGAISFGLVHIPISLHSAIEDIRPKMKMLDAESGAPVGYKKVSKTTGEELSQEQVVKGAEVDRGQYVTLTKEEIRQALPKTMETIEIESFVKLNEVPTVFFTKPYFCSPSGKGAGKVYALLREVLKRTGRVGLGRVVVSTKQHLALVLPQGDGLVVNLLRWHGEVREMSGLQLPGSAKEVGLSDRELKMGEQLVLDLADEWHPERYRDEFAEKVAALIEAKRKAGEVKQVVELMGDEVAPASADVIDLTELLQRSLRGKATPAPAQKKAAPTKSATRKAANDDEVSQRAAAAAKPATMARATVKPKRKAA